MINRIEENNNSKVFVSNEIAKNKNLSLRAKGLLLYMLSCENEHNFSSQTLQKETGNKRDTIENCLQELETFGYIRKEVKRVNGRFYSEISVFEQPLKEKTENNRCIEVGYIYVVKMGIHYKIGISVNPKKRLKEFTILPYELETVLCEKVFDYQTIEKELHEHFDRKCVRGEWFELDEQDLAYIRGYIANKIVDIKENGLRN